MNRETWTKIFAVGILVIAWLILIGIKISNPEQSIRTPLIIAIVVSIGGVITFFWSNIYSKLKSKENIIPEPLTEQELEEVIKYQVSKMWNHLLINGGIEDVRSRVINKNLIYAVKINLLYEEKFGNSCWLIINANYPDMKPTMMSPQTIYMGIERGMNWKAQSPFDEPDVTETEEKVDDFGRPMRKTKETKHKKKEEEKKEDVV